VGLEGKVHNGAVTNVSTAHVPAKPPDSKGAINGSVPVRVPDVTNATSPQITKLFDLVVVSVFKNESWILDDWIKHYIAEGVSHFYLLDNGSEDNYTHILQAYPSELFTLVVDPTHDEKGMQDHLMNKHFTSLVKEQAEWVLVVDIDEYVYATNSSKCMTEVIHELPPNIIRIWLPWKYFGSNGHIHQPSEGVIAGFTKRSEVSMRPNSKFFGFGKSLVKVTRGLKLLTHYSLAEGSDPHKYLSDGTKVEQYAIPTEEDRPDLPVVIDEKVIARQPLQINHYGFMSRDYYEQVKCARGGGQSGHSFKYTMDFYAEKESRHNAMVDTELLQRHRSPEAQRCRWQPQGTPA
jgi:hypothetical protein